MLIVSGWYASQVDTPAARLRYYAEHFPLVEVDFTYYARCHRSRRRRCGPGARRPVHLQYQCVSLFTQHPTRVNALPTDLRPEVEHLGKETVYLKDLPEAVTRQVLERSLSALAPLRQTGKLGAILLQFPPSFVTRSRSPAHTRTT